MLYIIYLILFILGLIFLFFPKNVIINEHMLKLDRMIKQDCSTETVKCIDSCDFLCTNNQYHCVNNICQLKNKINIKCNKETGGIVILTHSHFVPYWNCLCTNPDFFGGQDCSEKRLDICKNGTLKYEGNKMTCICNKPYELINIYKKPYCIESQYKNFFPELQNIYLSA